jgi:hypothetical protein
MPKAAKEEKVTNVAGVINEIKRKVKNISLNLQTGSFDIKDAKGAVKKTIKPESGVDAIYVVNRSVKEEDVTNSGEFLKAQRITSQKLAATIETAFAEKQDELMATVERWTAAAPGATKVALAIEVGRIQRELATIERRLRDAQYSYREALPYSALRRLYSPLSNDDRVTPYSVYKLTQTLNRSNDRVMGLSE